MTKMLVLELWSSSGIAFEAIPREIVSKLGSYTISRTWPQTALSKLWYNMHCCPRTTKDETSAKSASTLSCNWLSMFQSDAHSSRYGTSYYSSTCILKVHIMGGRQPLKKLVPISVLQQREQKWRRARHNKATQCEHHAVS